MEGLSESMAKNLSLTTDEEEGIVVDNQTLPDRVLNRGYQLIGRIVTSREISAHTIKANVLRILQPVKACDVKSLGPNRFILCFEHRLDYNHAKNGCPWLMDKNACLLQDLEPDSDPTTMDIYLMNIIIRIHNLPISKRTVPMVNQIGSKVGDVVEILNSKQLEFHQYVRVKVRIDVNKCLKRGMNLHNLDGTKNWIAFTYERLPNFCFLCGLIGHAENRCPIRYEDNFIDPGEQLPYGMWMKATSLPESDHSRVPLKSVNEKSIGGTDFLAQPTQRGTNIFQFGTRKESTNHSSMQVTTMANLIDDKSKYQARTGKKRLMKRV
ncbi:PREDICTED: uncharacterized protein LOC105971262 [Erythranthe guttata]|uniref:uncharacterized protein LOC105971262 n=1 Tax=Erythranthe guttata TaxID=4155 RepID=UPI00064D88EB|nr:PREDICTED: uncharacterized protein LOC105971262 [Erythranthe guttata]|eukprot:XP_012851564.1 PREDICTED: uncharacterized protein LOC105971262 [Erythranthe guttata]